MDFSKRFFSPLALGDVLKRTVCPHRPSVHNIDLADDTHGNPTRVRRDQFELEVPGLTPFHPVLKRNGNHGPTLRRVEIHRHVHRRAVQLRRRVVQPVCFVAPPEMIRQEIDFPSSDFSDGFCLGQEGQLLSMIGNIFCNAGDPMPPADHFDPTVRNPADTSISIQNPILAVKLRLQPS